MRRHANVQAAGLRPRNRCWHWPPWNAFWRAEDLQVRQMTRREKCALFFLLCCRCCQALLRIFFFSAFFGPCVTRPRLGWRLPVALRPRVSNDLLSVRAPMPITRCALRLSTTAGKPGGGDPSSPTAAVQGPEKHRAASTSTTAGAGLRPETPRRLLCAPPPLGRPRSRGRARGQGVTGVPPPPSRGASTACHRDHGAPCPSHAAPSQAGNVPPSRPTPRSSSARADSPTWGCRGPGHARRGATGSAFSPRSPLPGDDFCTRSRQKMPAPAPRPPCSRSPAVASTDAPSPGWRPLRVQAHDDARLPTAPSAHSAPREAPPREAHVGVDHSAQARHPTAAGPPVARDTCAASSLVSPGDCAIP